MGISAQQNLDPASPAWSQRKIDAVSHSSEHWRKWRAASFSIGPKRIRRSVDEESALCGEDVANCFRRSMPSTRQLEKAAAITVVVF